MRRDEDEEGGGLARKLGLGLAGLATFAGVAYLIYNAGSGTGKLRPKEPPSIQIVDLPPPPPPPPPEPTPEVPQEEEVVEQEPTPIEQAPPEPTPEPPAAEPQAEAPPGDAGLNAEGEAGTDGFGLRAGKGGGLFGTGGGGGGGGYGQYAENVFRQALSEDRKLRLARADDDAFEVAIRVSIAADGTVRSVDVERSSGDTAFDSDVAEVIRKKGTVGRAQANGKAGFVRLVVRGRRTA